MPFRHSDSQPDACFKHYAGTREEGEIALGELANTDSIIIFGGLFGSDGRPQPVMQRRCEAAVSLKRHLSHHRHTIVSGGARGLPTEYRRANPNATEASLGSAYCRKIDPSPQGYLEEPYALETLGNIILSTALLIKHDLRRPVFVSELGHISRINTVLTKLFRKSPIVFTSWELREPPKQAIKNYTQQAEKAWEDGISGLLHPYRFADAINGLSGDLEENEKEIKTATEWLFATDPRYTQEYGARKL